MTDLKKIAGAFGMNVSKLADTLGYTKQGLYNAVQAHKSGNRMYAALRLLAQDSDHMYQMDQQRAELDRKCREDAIDEMAEACGLISPVKRK